LHLSGLDLLFWALGFFEHCALLGVLLLRRRASSFPIFTALIALYVVRTIVLYFTLHYRSSEAYFYTYWSLGFLDVSLQLAVAYELARHVFRPLGVWAPDVRRAFALLAVICVLVAAVLSWLASPPTYTVRTAIAIRGQFFSSALMSELLVAMIALSVILGLPWRTHVAAITQGFGIYAIFCILVDSAYTYFGSYNKHVSYASLSYVRMSLYCLCAAWWIVSLARNEPEPRKLPEQLRLELRTLQRQAALLLQGFRGMGNAS